MTTQIQEVSPEKLSSWITSGDVDLIDVRELDEHARERIVGSQPAPLSRFDPSTLHPSRDRKTVLYCRSGRRSAEAARHLIGAGWSEVAHLEGGIEGWKQAGHATEVDRRVPISIMRQVQITVGGIVLLASILSWLVSPLFVLIAAFMGAGLLFAGVTGTCGLAAVLGKMPWNRTIACGASCAGPVCSA
jgi:rhodanese-related sulfurtransferase